jgi:hypothetical protein
MAGFLEKVAQTNPKIPGFLQHPYTSKHQAIVASLS